MLRISNILLACSAVTFFAREVLADCSYSSLQQATQAYISGQATGAFATSVSVTNSVYTENFRTASIRTGLISKPLKIDYSRSLHDTVECATYTEVIVTDRAHPYVIGTQMRFNTPTDPASALTAKQIDSIITDQGDWLFNATGTFTYASREDWFVIPPERRDTRAAIKAGADAYLDLFNNKNVVVPWGTPCNRLEGGAYTGQGRPTDSCNVGVPSGVALVNRRYVIDETLGSVDVFLNFGGANGIPDSHEFRLENGKLRFVHTMTVMG
ncbi:hypothetical protein MD484_g4628, partial [Candolleomyces efflorescens]